MRRLDFVALVLGTLTTWTAAAADSPSILILYDNTAVRSDLQLDWGFAAVVTFRGHTILFDSGTKPDVLTSNMRALNVDPSTFEFGVFSHSHQDHVGGLAAVTGLRAGLVVHYLDAFPPAAFASAERLGAKPVRITEGRELLPGLFTTGQIAGEPPEQALVLETSKGLIVLTGCSHPGVVGMVEAARRLKPGATIRLVVGGFHMLLNTESQVRATIARLREMGVQSILPTHCTGVVATRLFREAFGEQFLSGGAGTRVPID